MCKSKKRGKYINFNQFLLSHSLPPQNQCNNTPTASPAHTTTATTTISNNKKRECSASFRKWSSTSNRNSCHPRYSPLDMIYSASCRRVSRIRRKNWGSIRVTQIRIRLTRWGIIRRSFIPWKSRKSLTFLSITWRSGWIRYALC